MGSRVPSLAVFLCPSRPSIPCSFVHISPVAGCDRVAVSCSQHVLHTFSLASFLTGSLSPFLPSSAATSGYFSVLLARVADSSFSFWADSWFRLVRVPALVGFFWPDCDFLVVIVPVASLSRIFVRQALLVCSAPPTPSCGSLQRRGCWCSLQHCRVVLCYGVVAGPAPLRRFTTT